MPVRERLSAEQRRAVIVAAAAEEFGRRGARDARMEDIAERAGVTKPVVYDHFPSKGALHAEVISRANDDLMGAVLEALARGGEPEPRYRAGLLAAFELIAARPDVRTLLLGDPTADPQVAEASVREQRRARETMAQLYLAEPGFLRGRRDRAKRAEHVAQAVIGTINAVAVLGVQEGLSPERLAGIVMDVVWPGIAAMVEPS